MTSASEIPVTLRGLVEHYSPSGAEEAAVNWLIEHMRSLGFSQSYADPAGNAVGLMGDGPQKIVLLGHIDTVPGEIPPRLEEGNYFGRGSVDAKGPLAVFVDAAAAVGSIPGWQVAVIGAVGEEQDSDGARFVVNQYRPLYAIIGEPSRWDRVTLGYKGSAALQLTTRRTLSHTARLDESACEAAFAAWERLRTWTKVFNQERTSAFDQLFTSLRGFDSDSDGFEEWASLHVGLRLPPDLPPETAFQELAAAAAPASLAVQGFAIPAFRGDRNNPLVRAFLNSVRSQGGQPGFLLKTGTADMNIVAPVWSCPSVAYGPGDSALDHTPDEHISLAEYARAVQVLVGVLRQLSKNQASQLQ
jgi:LysW-gamma-L-lysine carboxypeptidase